MTASMKPFGRLLVTSKLTLPDRRHNASETITHQVMKITANQVIAGALVVIASPIALLYAGAALNKAEDNYNARKSEVALIAQALPEWIDHPTCFPATAWAELTGGPYEVTTAIRKHCN